MKILQVIQQRQLRGAEIFASQLSSELTLRGHGVHVGYLFDGDERLSEMFPALTWLPLRASKRWRLVDVNGYATLARLVRRNGYDLVQANAGDTLKYAALSRYFFGWKTPLVFRNANKLTDFLHGPIHRWFNHWLLGQCDYCISVSERCRQDLLGFFPAANGRSRTIPIGTYLKDINSFERDRGHGITLISIGSFVREKNHRFLLEVFVDLRKRHPDAKLLLLGKGPLEDELRRQVASLQLHDCVRFLGVGQNIGRWLQSADVLVMPSLVEGLPAAILEAMAHGVPVVASSVGGIRDVIQDGVNGYSIERFSTAEYVQRIIHILQPGAREKLARAAYDTVRREYHMDLIAEQFLEAYKQII